MPNEHFRYWLEIAASLATVGALAAIALELLRARRADSQENSWRIGKRHTEIAGERIVFENGKFRNLDEFLLLLENQEYLVAYRAVYNFWDMVITSARTYPANKLWLISSLGELYMRWYSTLADVIHESEAKFGWRYFDSFDWFANEIESHFPNYGDASEYNRKAKAYVKSLRSESG